MKHAKIAQNLWGKLWRDYSRRVEYARIYQQMIAAAAGVVANDHIAFRSLRLTVDTANGIINLGLPYLADLIETLGYTAAGEYEFPDQHLYARHYRHPEQDRFDLPKLFISELIVDALPAAIAEQIEQTVCSSQFYNLQSLQHQMKIVSSKTANPRPSQPTAAYLVDQLHQVFTRPWPPPKRSVVETVNPVSQYGAWVLLHGYAVNHFTGYINRQQTPLYPDIESTASGLAERGIPMKAEIEGSQGSGLRQTATRAVTEWVTVQDDNSGELTQIPWTYAYYEIAERNWIEVEPGRTELFEGFLGSQARNLFEMTHKV
ncbi:MAG: DUF1338 domain-containing protein [Pseudanabaenales cyanobacterium]|nr:DUF1338 domain-containing protein [Pseudanabaenales cyanobacterium]